MMSHFLFAISCVLREVHLMISLQLTFIKNKKGKPYQQQGGHYKTTSTIQGLYVAKKEV